MTRGPDFFLIGAPKCGTSALADYLGQHPEIGMCPRKETHFFADDQLFGRQQMHPGRRRKTLTEYLSWFETLQGRRLGEASVWYLYSRGSGERIKAFRPDAQLIAMIRNPITAVPALHSEFVHMGIEPVRDLESALALDEERVRGGAPPGFPPASYRSAFRYAEQLKAYFDLFGRESIHIVVFDDFKRDTAGAFRGVCRFLGVDSDFDPEIRIVNANKEARVPGFQRLVKRPPTSVRRALRVVTTEDSREWLQSRLSRLNTRNRPRGRIPPAVAAALLPEVENQCRELRELIGLDLTAWLEESDRIASG
ncbi:MAG: sulfotransferase [Solirubrobacterales bacterium]|nr:sulfotransferase [Solirubrobacterales bacterium]